MERTLIASFDRVYIDELSRESAVAKRLQKIFPSEKLEFVSQAPLREQQGELSADQFARSKRLLYIKPFAGSFFKRCPGFSQKKALTCCNYHVLNLGQQCNFNCSYCYLQSYLNSPTMIIFSNIESALAELQEMAANHEDKAFRVGTGEVIDSLSLDPLTLYSHQLIEFFSRYPRWTVELKTKSANVDQFINCAHVGNVLISWSVNPAEIVNSEEHGTARLAERLQAARKCADHGFPVAFHIDPMIWHPQWQKNYGELAESIFSLFSAQEVQLISLGSLRFQPEQRHMMRERFGMSSKVVQAEMFPSEGGKLRVDANLRREMFQFMIEKFKNHDSRWKMLMCMETPESWISTYETSPMKMDELRDLFRPLPKVDEKMALKKPTTQILPR